MAKASFLMVSALCVLALAGLVHSQTPETLTVEGKVYCDTCRVQFETKLSQPIIGAKVRLECKTRDLGNVTYSVEGFTNSPGGMYRLTVEGDHENEICEVGLVQSSMPDCVEPMIGLEKARVVCTKNNGMMTATRLANPLGFMKKEAVAGCKEALDEMGFLPWAPTK